MDVLDEARMRTLPPDTRMLWLDIARMMQRDGIAVLRFGSQPVKPNMLSRLVFRPETETETELETKITELCERGLLAREPDGAISCPMLVQATTRSEINKINGSKGGRPRKDGQPPGQRHLLLPIDGGVAMKTEKTKLETEPRETGSSINNKDNKESFDLMKTGGEVLDAAGIDPARWMGNYQPVANWLRLG
ncbi:MAG: hypothetical protein KGH75_14315, partial [Rhodospirillales bacterium]|nr:hypothetical protein [Rhodospirillales bacterium]